MSKEHLRQWTAADQSKGVAERARRRSTLSERERLFAQGIVGGLSRVAALRQAGYGVHADAREILAKPQVVRYIDQVHDRQVRRLDYSIDNLCARLELIAYAAVEEKQYAPAVSAVMGIAKMMGHLMDRTEIEMHIISKPAREPTREVELTPEEWQRQFAPKAIQ